MISPYKKDNLVLNLSFQLALDIIEYVELLEGKKKFNMAHQLFRSGTSVHANIREAQNSESKADFIHKINWQQKKQKKLKAGFYYASFQNFIQNQENCYQIIPLF